MSKILQVFPDDSFNKTPLSWYLVLDCGHWYLWTRGKLPPVHSFDCPNCQPPSVVMKGTTEEPVTQLPSALLSRFKFPLRWDGDDLLDANNRVIVWGKEGPDDPRDDIDSHFGRIVADVLNQLAPQAADKSVTQLSDGLDAEREGRS